MASWRQSKLFNILYIDSIFKWRTGIHINSFLHITSAGLKSDPFQ